MAQVICWPIGVGFDPTSTAKYVLVYAVVGRATGPNVPIVVVLSRVELSTSAAEPRACDVNQVLMAP